MISQDDAESAVEWIGKYAKKMAEARAQRVYMEQWVKTVKATIQSEQVGLSSAAAETVALASPRYMEALQAYKQAIEADEYFRFLVSHAEARIEAWRSQESTRRAEGRATA